MIPVKIVGKTPGRQAAGVAVVEITDNVPASNV